MPARFRCGGRVKAVREAGASIVGHAIADDPGSIETRRQQTLHLLGSDAPDAIVHSNDDTAIGGIFHCLGAGIPVPEKSAIFGFNGLGIGQALPRPLSTVRSNRCEIGEIAVDAILTLPERPATKTIIDTGFEMFAGETS